MSARAPVAPAAVEALFELSTEARVEVGTAAPWACREEDSVVEAADAAVVLLMMVEQLEDGRGSWCWGWSIVLDLPLKTIKVALNSNVTKHHSSAAPTLALALLLPFYSANSIILVLCLLLIYVEMEKLFEKCWK